MSTQSTHFDASFERDRHARNRVALLLVALATIAATVATWGQSARDILRSIF
jgi:hypothetical protein